MSKAKSRAGGVLQLGRLGKMSELLGSADRTKRQEMPQLPLDVIDEDPNNPRQNIDPEKLKEFAAFIKKRGLTSAISVRPNPEAEGRYIVNYGHRRLLAARLAKKKTIPVIITSDFVEEDRLTENIHREDLSMMEIAAYIGKQLAKGLSQAQIAERIAKSESYVSQYARLLKASPLIRSAIERSKLNDLTTINEVMRLEKKNPETVSKFLSGDAPVTRGDLNILRESVKEMEKPAARSDNTNGGFSSGGDVVPTVKAEDERLIKNVLEKMERESALPLPSSPGEGTPANAPGGKGGAVGRGMVKVMHAKGEAALLTDRPSRSEKHIWIRFDGVRGEKEVLLSSLKMVAYITREGGAGS